MRRPSEGPRLLLAFRGALLAAFLAAFLAACSGGTGPIGSVGLLARREPESHRVIVTDAPVGLGAAQAGVEPGDEIVAVDGRPVAPMSVRDFSLAVRGEVGSHVILTIKRSGVTHDVEVTRTPLK